jgi:hypothetical protein
MKSAAEEIVEFEKQVAKRDREAAEGLRRFHNRTHYEATTEFTPLDSLIGSEEGNRDDRRETINRIFGFLIAKGPHPAEVLRRLFALGAHMGISPFCDLTLREKKLLLGGSHGTHHWLMKKLCEDPLRRKGAKSWKAPGQKSLKSRKRYSRCQQGNTNRRSSKTK